MKRIVSSIAMFMAAFIIMRHVYPAGIVFYQGIGLAASLSLLQYVVARRIRTESFVASAKDAVLTFLLIYAFVFTVPTTVDRSYSVKMIQHLSDAPAGLSRDDIGRLYVTDFVDSGGVDQRLMEQTATGTLYQQNGRYRLTAMGQMLSLVFRSMEVVYACGH